MVRTCTQQQQCRYIVCIYICIDTHAPYYCASCVFSIWYALKEIILLQKPTVCHKCKCTLYQQTLTVSTHHWCLLFTPWSSSNFRQCSHSNNVLHPSIQSSQNSGVCRRWDWKSSWINPWLCIFCTVLHLILSDGQFPLGSSPGHIQNKIPIFHGLSHRYISDFGLCQQDVRMKHPITSTIHTNMVGQHTFIAPYIRESSTSCVMCTYT